MYNGIKSLVKLYKVKGKSKSLDLTDLQLELYLLQTYLPTFINCFAHLGIIVKNRRYIIKGKSDGLMDRI